MKKALIGLRSSLLVLALFLASSYGAAASTGVTINTGKIVLDSALAPGGTYTLPSNIQVKNTGTEPSDYGISVEYNDVQTEQKPAASWFHFDPTTFHLLPGEAKLVKVTIAVDASAPAGNYFAYVEAHTITQNGSVGGAISGAAATKVYFSVDRTNMFKSTYYGMLSFVKNHQPWSNIIIWILVVIIVYYLIRRIASFVKQN